MSVEVTKALAKQRMRLAVGSLTTAGPATFVPAGIVAVTRAQERGYALVSIG